jgi:CRISPR/Cas system CSM-associated protein Csm3 (group 7 of RAMP superfamily)
MKLSTLINQSNIQSYTLTATISSALSVGAGGSAGSLADKPIVRNGSGDMIIPGSHLKGRLRHECEKIARSLHWEVSRSPNPRNMVGNYNIPQQSATSRHCIISCIFGDASLASCVLIDDLICQTNRADLPTEVIRPGVTINRRRRTAEDQKLYLLETSPPNLYINDQKLNINDQKLKFAGEIHLINPPQYATALICAGLKHIHALGGSKSAGLGWLSWDWGDIQIPEEAWAALGRGSST